MARRTTPKAEAADGAPEALGLVDAVAQLSFAVHAILGAAAAEHDLSITQLRLIGVLRDREPSMLELARLLALEKSSVTGLIDRAQQRGLVERTRGAADGRAVHVRLTVAGHAAARALTAEATTRITALVAPLAEPDRAALTRLAAEVVAGARASEAPGPAH